MAVNILTGVMNTLLAKLEEVLRYDYSETEFAISRAFRYRIWHLKQGLSCMNDLLQKKLPDMETLDIQQRELRSKVRELAYSIEDKIDMFMHSFRAVTDQAGLLTETMDLMLPVLSGKIDEIIHAVEEGRRSERYNSNLDESINSWANSSTKIDRSSSSHRLVGMDVPSEVIVQLLTEDMERGSGQRLKVVSIVGVGGLGKTALANQVYKKVQGRFDCTAFVSASQNRSISMVLSDILSQVKYDGPADDIQSLIDATRENVARKRFLIVIDDISSVETWNSISGFFVENNCGSTIITTTRSRRVANACCSNFHGILFVYKMKPLGWTDSRSLFFRRIYGSENYSPEPEELIIALDILEKCGGVPLAIVVIASLLASQDEVNKLDNWLKIKYSMGFELERNPNSEWMKHILKLCYNFLSWELKTCFLYLHMYPENYNIMKKDLIRQWISEGFITERDDEDLEDIAESYFSDFINRSLIKPAEFEYGEVISCRVVHKLLLDFIVQKSTEENFVTVITNQICSGQGLSIRRLSYQCNHGRNMIQASECVQVRSFANFRGRFYQCAENLPCLLMFRALRVLNLRMQGCFAFFGSYDLSPICNLLQLRYLKMEGDHFQFPDTVGELRYLQVVDIGGWCGDLEFIGGFLSDACLPSLRHLSIPQSAKLGRGINRLSSIRTLEEIDFCSCSIENIRHLGMLTNLTTLRIIYSRRRGYDEDDQSTDRVKFAALATSLRELGSCNLRCLDIRVPLLECRRQPPIGFLCSWSPRPQFLQRLHLHMIFFFRVPCWIQQLGTLTSLRLKVDNLEGDDMRVLTRLPCLTYLDLQAMKVPGKDIVIDRVSFPALKELKLIYRSSTLSIEPRAMPKLRTAHLIVFGQVEEQDARSLVGIQHLHMLEDIIITYDDNNVRVAFSEALNKHPMIGSIRAFFYSEGEFVSMH
ncbi:disease resistance protein RGA5-like [Oryza brachyantha]|uniref:Uncharacterized protein n=1 Tax=Oryza brachyantha TaxID=4533 RepID=J3KUE1_ORYBR|nr:disease resistance protein RGA5-like [Oryza brachyantha]